VKRAKRVIWSMAALLAAGALAAVFVAEGVGLSRAVDYNINRLSRVGSMDLRGRWVRVYRASGPGWRYMWWAGASAPSTGLQAASSDTLPPWVSLRRPHPWTIDPATGNPLVYEQGADIGLGWPATAFSMNWSEATGKISGGMLVGAQKPGTHRVVAWRPVLPGLLVDAMVWTGLIAGVVALPRAAIWSRRRWRGGCPKCGYDLRGLESQAHCPECGTATANA
jgi:hypothetical protein